MGVGAAAVADVLKKQTGRVDEPAYAPPQYRELDAEAEAAENGDGNAQTAS